MKRHIYIIGLLILLFSHCFAAAVFAANTSAVVYDGDKGEFDFQLSDDSGLFGNLQDIMPGDHRTAKLRVEMKNLSAPARLYLRAESCGGDAKALEPLVLEIKNDGAAVNKAGSPGNDVLLGTFYDGDSSIFDMTLTVPVTVGNELAFHTDRLRWIFTVQEDGGQKHSGETVTPETGYFGASIYIYAAVMLIAAAGIAALLKKRPGNRQV